MMKATNLKPAINLTFDGQIFNLLYDAESKVLAIEIRNNAKYNASYAAFDLKKNKFINKRIQPAERWWTSMLALKKGNLILYQYHDQQNPDLKDIFALDIKKGRQQWLYSELQLRSVEEHSLLVSKIEEDRVVPLAIDLITGKIEPEAALGHQEKKEKKNIEQPFHYRENSDYFVTVSDFLQKHFDILPLQAIDYLESGQYIIISFYGKNPESEGLYNKLLVLDTEGNLLLQETMSQNLKGVGMDTFVIIDRLLIMIKDKTTLKGYKL